jgi:hypothetical protein
MTIYLLLTRYRGLRLSQGLGNCIFSSFKLRKVLLRGGEGGTAARGTVGAAPTAVTSDTPMPGRENDHQGCLP